MDKVTGIISGCILGVILGLAFISVMIKNKRS